MLFQVGGYQLWAQLGSNRADRLKTVRWTVLGRSQHVAGARDQMGTRMPGQ
jgi:hypothetical protein